MKPEKRIADALLRGKAVITLTDTVYGILAINEDLILRTKQRDNLTKRTIQLIHSPSQIKDPLPKDLANLINKYWPGSLTIIYKGKGYRVPNRTTLIEAIKIVGVPIFASSANLTGQPTVESLKQAKQVFKNTDIPIEYIHSPQERTTKKRASTVFNYDNKQILREGDITSEDISKLISIQE